MGAPGVRPDYFNLPTDALGAHLRLILAAIEKQIADNPGAPAPLRAAVHRLEAAAKEFTEELHYRRP
jgi:hypothetical protein